MASAARASACPPAASTQAVAGRRSTGVETSYAARNPRPGCLNLNGRRWLRQSAQPLTARITRQVAGAKASAADGNSAGARQEASVEYIKSRGPFLAAATIDALSEKVRYKSPLEYQYSRERGQPLDAETTQSDVLYSSTLSREEYSEAMGAFKEALGRLPGSGVRIERSFRPDPSTYILRWCITWNSGGRPVRAQGSSKYTLDKEGLICGHEDSWAVEPRDAEAEAPEFGDALAFAATRIPPGGNSPIDQLPAIRLAAWEALKSNPNYGGQLVREELDLFTMQMVFACLGLVASLAVLVGRVLFLASSK